MSNDSAPATLELLLIRNDPPCRRCHAVEEVLRSVAESFPGRVRVRTITTTDAESARYGAILPPMVVVNGKVACAGTVPVRSGLEKLVAAELAR